MNRVREVKSPHQRVYGPAEPINKDTIKRLFKYVTLKYKGLFVFVVLCIIISGIAGVIGQLFIQRLIDDYIVPLMGIKNPNFAPLANALIVITIIYIIGIVCNYLYRRLMVNVSQGVQKTIRDEMFSHMETLPLSYFDQNVHGDIMSHYTNDIDTLREMLSQSIPQCISSFITIIAIVIGMLYLNPTLTLILLAGICGMLFMSKKISDSSSKYFVDQQKSLGVLNGFIEEMIDGQKVIKVFSHEEESKNDFDKLNSELCYHARKANEFANIVGPINNQTGNLLYGLIALIGGIIAVKTNILTLGTIAAFLTLTKSFIGPINLVTYQLNSIIMALAGATRIFALIDETSEQDGGYVKLVRVKLENDRLVQTKENTNMWAWKNNDELIPLKGDVKFKDVNFSYDGEKEVLHDIDLRARPGEKIAFVGSTGAGKTTLTNLINRFYDIENGTITYDGINISDINKKDLRASLGMILQDTNLFNGTIMDNIKYGVPNANDEDCIKASKLANAHNFIKRLPDGYQTLLTGNGSQLSQGQRQLIAIARCAIINPPVMILDEATSSIDTRTEKLIEVGMDKLMEGRTVFVIAHRLSTVRNAKMIIVLENGMIIERGSHEELLKLKGRYYDLYTGAFELE